MASSSPSNYTVQGGRPLPPRDTNPPPRLLRTPDARPVGPLAPELDGEAPWPVAEDLAEAARDVLVAALVSVDAEPIRRGESGQGGDAIAPGMFIRPLAGGRVVIGAESCSLVQCFL